MSQYFQRLCGLCRKGIFQYDMIQSGDRICVGVSGGKDSVILTLALSKLRQYMGIDFQIVALTLDPKFFGKETDYSPLSKLFAENDIEYVIKRTEIGPIIFDERKESNPCSLCARMRRGALHDGAIELGCNKIALGHHLDDAIETFYMNLWNEGRIGTFSPVTYLSKKGITMIRPMALAMESDIVRGVNELKLPIVKSTCPNGRVHKPPAHQRFYLGQVQNRPLFQTEEPQRFSKKGLGRLGDKKRVGEKGKPQFSATCFIFLLFIDIYHGVSRF
ncbi:MAG: tRNA 2-thiocytidine biosynthesis TtcA family protein [Oscillospiraceae bacterium]